MVRAVEKLLPKAGGSIYRLVRMASNRAMEISEGKPRLIKTGVEKETTVALQEILAGKVICKNATEAIKEQDEIVKQEAELAAK